MRDRIAEGSWEVLIWVCARLGARVSDRAWKILVERIGSDRRERRWDLGCYGDLDRDSPITLDGVEIGSGYEPDLRERLACPDCGRRLLPVSLKAHRRDHCPGTTDDRALRALAQEGLFV